VFVSSVWIVESETVSRVGMEESQNKGLFAAPCPSSHLPACNYPRTAELIFVKFNILKFYKKVSKYASFG
jgi:hypothetical protein